ncbi:recombinase family protein [Vibrio crassostreae]|uniref:recombinase family protein n=1 Tax=Vibrio crassostreae TaxID=246167 RepID=UPI00200A1F36|nr:recombinase family protein [Vibrio crassostreae]UPR29371.1 recombinase family protein [Vibrio crassostreae]
MKTAYSYIRFSSSRQADGDSIRRQAELAIAYADKHGLNLQDVSISDFGVSAFRGTNATEGELGEFLRLVDSGDIASDCYLLVESLDRLSRDKVRKALRLFLSIIDRGITVVTLSDNRVYSPDSDNDMELLMSILIMSRANNESEMKSQRTSAAWNKARLDALNGIKAKNSRLPDWLSWNDDKTGFVVDQSAKEIVQRVFELSAGGSGIEIIARTLNEEGSRTFKQGKDWRSSGVSKLLRNRAVIGEFQFYQKDAQGKREPIGEPIIGYYPELVSKQLFLAVQQGMDLRNKRGSGNRSGQFTNLFTGLIRCGECGSAVVTSSQTTKTPQGYLKCTMRCESKARMNYKYTEPQVLSALSSLQSVIEKYRTPISDETASIELDIRFVSEKISSLETLLDNAFTPRLAEKLHEAELQLAQANAMLNTEQQRVSAQLNREQIVLGLEPLESIDDRRAFNSKLRTVIDRIEMIEHPDKKGSALIYFINDCPVMEQHFTKLKGSHGTGSEVYELHVDDVPAYLGKTTSKKPLEFIVDETEDRLSFMPAC